MDKILKGNAFYGSIIGTCIINSMLLWFNDAYREISKGYMLIGLYIGIIVITSFMLIGGDSGLSHQGMYKGGGFGAEINPVGNDTLGVGEANIKLKIISLSILLISTVLIFIK